MVKKTGMGLMVGILIAMLFVGSAFATLITGDNVRPVPVQLPSYGDSLQTILNGIFPGVPGVDVITDQSSTAMWQTSTPPPTSGTLPFLAAEWLCTAGGDCSSNALQSFGLFSAHDTAGPITRVPVFFGPAVQGDSAAIRWLDNDTIRIGDPFGAGTINVGTFDGIEASFFGFYYQFGGTVLYSFDGLNPLSGQTQAAALSYRRAPGSDTWVVAFDANAADAPGTGGLDYNDLVVKIESIMPVPEPSTLLLLGSGLVGLAGVAWRRRRS